jgi:transposase
MSRRKKGPLRPLSDAERDALNGLSRSSTAPAAQVARAKLLLLVADGPDYQQAAFAVGRSPGDAVSSLVTRFNREGLKALVPRHAGGRRRDYDQPARARILREAQRAPSPQNDGTASWSLSTLQKALRRAADGLPAVSTFTIWEALHEAGYSYQRGRSWCPTGEALRKRKAGVVAVVGPDAQAKKS